MGDIVKNTNQELKENIHPSFCDFYDQCCKAFGVEMLNEKQMDKICSLLSGNDNINPSL